MSKHHSLSVATMPVEAVAPEPAEASILQKLEEAFAKRDKLSQSVALDPKELEAQDNVIKALVLKFDEIENFDPETEPVLHYLSEMAKRRDVLAVRLLMQPREKFSLKQVAPPAQPLIDLDVVINGLKITLPRPAQQPVGASGDSRVKKYRIPESISLLLDAADYE